MLTPNRRTRTPAARLNVAAEADDVAAQVARKLGNVVVVAKGQRECHRRHPDARRRRARRAEALRRPRRRPLRRARAARGAAARADERSGVRWKTAPSLGVLRGLRREAPRGRRPSRARARDDGARALAELVVRAVTPLYYRLSRRPESIGIIWAVPLTFSISTASSWARSPVAPELVATPPRRGSGLASVVMDILALPLAQTALTTLLHQLQQRIPDRVCITIFAIKHLACRGLQKTLLQLTTPNSTVCLPHLVRNTVIFLTTTRRCV